MKVKAQDDHIFSICCWIQQLSQLIAVKGKLGRRRFYCWKIGLFCEHNNKMSNFRLNQECPGFVALCLPHSHRPLLATATSFANEGVCVRE